MLHQLLATLRDLNIRLFLEDGNLKCNAPTGTLTDELVQQIKIQKAELIDIIGAATQKNVLAITPKQRISSVPLSYAQQRLWFLDQLEPNSPFYNIPVMMRLTGKLNIAALTQSFNEIIRRHEILRTAFEVRDGEPLQTIRPNQSIEIEQIDLTALQRNQQEIWETLCRNQANKPFNLENDLLVRATLLILTDSVDYQECILTLTMHHIISDGWSLTVLVKEFTALYEAFSQNLPSPLAELPIQYADFACWQRRWLTGKALEQQLTFWRKQLTGASHVLEFPADYARSATMSYRGAEVDFEIPLVLSEQIRALSTKQNVTLFMFLLAVFKILLSRYSNQYDISVGTPVAGRNHLEIEGLIGFFVNTLVLRSNLAGNPTFIALLAQIKEIVLAAQCHQDLPFEKLVEVLQPERDSSRSPLFQVMFVLQNQEKFAFNLPNLEISVIENKSQTAKFDLTLHIQDWSNGKLSGTIEYNIDLFECATIEQVIRHYLQLLQAVVDQPCERIFELPLLNAEEKQKILHTWNASRVDYPQDCSIHQLFEMQVAQIPNAIALKFGNQSLTYAELNKKANQLAHYLSNQGIGSDISVGICLERSLEMVIGLLGILKAGGAYVPIDPHYPVERISYMLKDAGVKLLVTKQTFATILGDNQQMIYIDQDWAMIDKYPSFNLPHRNHLLDLAYIIYTSGSTGQPKGVAVTHRNALHSTVARFTYYADAVKVYLLLSSFAFDSSVAGIFWTFGQGGCLCLPSEEDSKDPTALIDLIEHQHVSHLLALPSLYAMLLKQPMEKLISLTTAIVAGEVCATEVVKQHFTVLPHVKLHNEYGPTEGTVWSSVYQANVDDLNRALSIGRSVSHVQLYILDNAFNPVPVGVTGELYVGGEGVVRGYLHRPELTAEHFVPDPFQNNGNRLYKTGDLARYRSDGTIEFLGRIDHQVKIRGFRIELGEIEAQIFAHCDVKDVVVLAREDRLGDKRLIAYLVENKLGSLQLDSLKLQLKQMLPNYMIPNTFVILDALPLNANGKVDRKCLPLPEMPKQLNQQYVAPRTEMEIILGGIWQDVLGVEHVGVEDNFFELGGHSLLATQLAFAIEKALKIKFPVKRVFEKSNIAKQARWLMGQEDDEFIDLQSETQLANGIFPLLANPLHISESDALLLTGATGFLGAFLLVDLLAKTQAKVYCLIRATDEKQALNRLKQQLIRYELVERVDWQRVIPVCGDLAIQHLGLSDKRYSEISNCVDAIFHNGAWVNFVQPYQALKAANVSSCIEVLRLAATKRPKAIHYISTLSVFAGASFNSQGFTETDEPLLNDKLINGYAQSKWVAEKLLRLAKSRGFQITVYRPATVAGDSQNGVWNTDDFMCRMLKGCVQMGLMPDVDTPLDMVPVDHISQAIVALALAPNSWEHIFHLNHPNPPMSHALIDWFIATGLPLRKVSHRQWIEALQIAAKDIPDFALMPLLTVFTDNSDADDKTSHQKAAHYNCKITQVKLAELGVGYEKIGDALLECYQNYFARSGFLSIGK